MMCSPDNAKQYAVNWNNHMSHIKRAFDNLLNNSELTDVTLYAEEKKIGAHKMLLSACSSYFRELFREFPQEHPIIVLKGVRYAVLVDILKFIYNGEVSVDSEIFDCFLQTAEFLRISGLTDEGNQSDTCQDNKTNSSIDVDESEEVIESKKGKRSNLNMEWNSRLKKVNKTNRNLGCDTFKYKPSDLSLSTIFTEDLEDSLQENPNFSPELILQTVDEETKEPPASDLQCPICFKVFSHPYSLHHHKPVHSGGTKCPICHAVLSRKYNLKMHMRSRHNVI